MHNRTAWELWLMTDTRRDVMQRMADALEFRAIAHYVNRRMLP